jgi:hypothetical protein
VHATRREDGSWPITPIEPAAQDSCGSAPTADGETCQRDFTISYPVALVSTESQVRWILERYRVTGQLTGVCPQGPPGNFDAGPAPTCTWEGQSTIEAQLALGWLEGTTPRSTVLRTTTVMVNEDQATYGLGPSASPAEVDAAGRIHLVIADLGRLGNVAAGTTLSHVVIGAP